MKRCPQCGQTYTESDINFCLNDGELLSRLSEPPAAGGYIESEPPPTVMMDRSRVTDQTNWPTALPPVLYQSPTPTYVNPATGFPQYSMSQDQTLPTIALALGLGAVVMICCHGGIWLGVPAAIVGFLGMRNADNDSARYGGRGLAIAGMILGIVTFLISMVILIVSIGVNTANSL